MTTLYTSLHAAMGQLGAIGKDAKSEKHRYATLGAVLDAVRPVLWTAGLVLSQDTETGEYGVTVHTHIIHAATGERLTTSVCCPPSSPQRKDGTDVLPPTQAVGVAISYARRYGLLCVLGLATEDYEGAAPASVAAPADPRTAALDALGDRIGSDVARQRIARIASGDPADCPGVQVNTVRKLSEAMGGNAKGWRDLRDEGFAALLDAVGQQWSQGGSPLDEDLPL